MLIYLLRHGDAPYDSNRGERSLSPQGKKETEKVVTEHLDELSTVDLILCSPSLRAKQTLEVLIDSIHYAGEHRFVDALRSEGSVPIVEQYVDSLQVEKLLLISHQPLVGQLLEYLTDESGLGYRMGTSALACLEAITFGRGCAELKALTLPS